MANARTTSPFASYSDVTRELAAKAMVSKRETEIKALSEALAQATTTKKRHKLQLRIRASKNNLQSWIDYLADGCPRVAGAVIIP